VNELKKLFPDTNARSPSGAARSVLLPALLPIFLACGGASRPGPPVIHAFKAEPERVSMGEEVVLTASYSHGNGMVAPSAQPLASGGTLKVGPTATTTYTLRVTDDSGRAAVATTDVVVAPSLAVQVRGQGDAAAEVRVEGPGGFVRTLTASATLPEIPPGDYTITAQPLRSGNAWIQPLAPVQKVQVTTGTEVQVAYLAPTVTLYLNGAVPLEMVLVRPGTFIMGSNAGDWRHYPSPRPPHQVSIPQSFYVARFPTTQAQWGAVLGDNPSRTQGPDLPVTNVSFDRIQNEFLPELNRKLPATSFRLPTEAEWEYFCRAGTTTDFFFGPEERLEEYAWVHKDDDPWIHPVGLRKGNPWGVHDLIGQVFQWCQDVAHDGYQGAPQDGSARLEPDGEPAERILRGFDARRPLSPDEARSFSRWHEHPGAASDFVGFRIIMNVSQIEGKH
jgi:formylglycine-generating enzyme required for sulfatase activity